MTFFEMILAFLDQKAQLKISTVIEAGIEKLIFKIIFYENG